VGHTGFEPVTSSVSGQNIWLGRAASSWVANDSANAFREYAASGTWTVVHIGQFVGPLLVYPGVYGTSQPLCQESGVARALAVVGR